MKETAKVEATIEIPEAIAGIAEDDTLKRITTQIHGILSKELSYYVFERYRYATVQTKVAIVTKRASTPV